MPDSGALLTLASVTKRFPGVTALSNVDLSVTAGEVHVLLGENGAGKSTLVKILAGVERPDSGRLTLHGTDYRPTGPQDALRAGVRMVHQELSLLSYLSVAENLFFERLPRRAGALVDYRRLHREARGLLERVGLDVSPRRRVETLSLAQCQLVEIARALSARSRVLILDEPTASLTGRETDRLFDIIGRLRADGVSVIYISHHLEEVFRIGDRVTVLRNGERVDTRPLAGLTAADLVRMMVGRDLAQEYPFPQTAGTGPDRLVVRDLRPRSTGQRVSFTVRGGEILGIAGLVGAGRSETVRAIFGADPVHGGGIEVDGRAVRVRHPRDAVRAGISLVTEDRRHQGLVLPMGADVNITLADLAAVSRAGLLRRGVERHRVTDLIGKLRIRTPSPGFPTRNLSGGNQQKVVIARWLMRDSKVLIVDEPTRGIDVGARYEIYRLLGDLVGAGKAVVMVSSDLPELLGMCHRLLVFSRGRIAGELARPDFDQYRVLSLAYEGYLGAERPETPHHPSFDEVTP